MDNQEIIQKWKQGLSKNRLALIYKRKYNMEVKLIRADLSNRHSGKFINYYDALKFVENVIYNYILTQKNK